MCLKKAPQAHQSQNRAFLKDNAEVSFDVRLTSNNFARLTLWWFHAKEKLQIVSNMSSVVRSRVGLHRIHLNFCHAIGKGWSQVHSCRVEIGNFISITGSLLLNFLCTVPIYCYVLLHILQLRQREIWTVMSHNYTVYWEITNGL